MPYGPREAADRVLESRGDQRMQQLLEIAAKRRIVECAAAQRSAVELAVGADERSAERFDDGAVARFAAPADRVRDVVGVEDVGAAAPRTRAATSDLPLPMPPVRPTSEALAAGVTDTSP